VLVCQVQVNRIGFDHRSIDSISIYLGRHIYIVLYLCLITDFAVTIVLTLPVARALSLLEGRNLCSVASHGHVPS
jgi:hypothetical protein